MAKKKIQKMNTGNKKEIGYWMTDDYIALPRILNREQALRSVVRQAEDCEHVSTLYVVDEHGRLCGGMSLQQLFTAGDVPSLEPLYMPGYPFVYAGEKVSDCLSDLQDYAEDTIPVVDNTHHLLGVITAQRLMEALNDTRVGEYAHFAALSERTDLHETPWQSTGKRLPWLIVLMTLGLLVSTVTGMFEGVMAHLPLVVAFQSLILDMAGNVGTQSLAVTIRVLTDGDVTFRKKLGLLFKELRIGACNGLLMGLLSCVLVGLYIHWGMGQELSIAFAVSCCLGAAMLISMMISSLSGTAIPMVMKAVGIDPAVASGPLITTVNDMVAVVTYYGLAMVLLLPIAS